MKIVFDLHTHTLFSSHAYSTIYENILWAEKNGLKGIAVTDHGCAMVDAGHPWHFACLSGTIPREVSEITVLSGIEANVLDCCGGLDIEDEWAGSLDVVIASMHGPVYTPGSGSEQLEALLKIAENPYVDIMGHPERSSFSYDFEPIVKKAVEYGKVIEINQHSLEMSDFYAKRCAELARLCKKYGAYVVVNTDAHFCTKIGKLDLALKMLDEIGVDEKLVINADYDRTIERFCK